MGADNVEGVELCARVSILQLCMGGEKMNWDLKLVHPECKYSFFDREKSIPAANIVFPDKHYNSVSAIPIPLHRKNYLSTNVT